MKELLATELDLLGLEYGRFTTATAAVEQLQPRTRAMLLERQFARLSSADRALLLATLEHTNGEPG